MATLGEQLRAAREHARLTVEEAAALTHIPREHLLSLESDDVTALPGLPFARGFIRIYADILKVPAEPLLAAHAAQLGEAQYDLRAQPGAARPGLGAVHVGVVLAAVAIAVVVAVLLLTRSAEPSAAGPAPRRRRRSVDGCARTRNLDRARGRSRCRADSHRRRERDARGRDPGGRTQIVDSHRVDQRACDARSGAGGCDRRGVARRDRC